MVRLVELISAMRATPAPINEPCPKTRPARSRTTQPGAVLVLGLVVLLVITVVGVTGMRTTVMQERMAGNMRQNNTALQAAEAALQAGLAYIEGKASPPIANSSGSEHVWPACSVDEASADLDGGSCGNHGKVLANWRGDAASLTEGSTYQAVIGELGESGSFPGVAAQPRVYIEVRYVAPLDAEEAARGVGVHYYTVTALGFGGSDKARAIVQSTVAKVYQF
ncbi:MAG: pilus assembly protein [Thiohalocapsa sp.]